MKQTQWNAERRQEVEDRLRALLRATDFPASLMAATDYSLLAGGKRLRPLLVLLACEACGGSFSDAMPAACAVEMVHTYSLIHDDLPCMDDDDFRRGRPTSHKVFGEALAVLAGDALLTLAFETLAASGLPEVVVAEQTRVLALAAGGSGMVGGQVLDLEAERGPFTGTVTAGLPAADLADFDRGRPGGEPASREESGNDANSSPKTRVEQLARIHRMKTGALITAALELGAISARADQEHRQRLQRYGTCVGLAFQIADDLLDVTGKADRLGKTPGRDLDLGKLTYPAVLGIEASRRKAEQLVQDACDAVSVWGSQSVRLQELARFIVERDH